mgnify:CR=1 FL=1
MKANQKFTRIVGNRSPEFPLLKEFVGLGVEQERFINFMNNVLDSLMANASKTSIREKLNRKGTPRITIIHTPHCPDEYRDLLIRFVILKSALFQNRTTFNRFKQYTKRPLDLGGETGKRANKKLCDSYNHLRNVCRKLELLQKDGGAGHKGVKLEDNRDKSLLILRDTDLNNVNSDNRIPFNEYIAELDCFTDPSRNLLVTTDESYGLESLIKAEKIKASKGEESSIPTLSNLYLFHTPNKMNVLKSYNIDQLRRLNEYGLGIKQLIVFSQTSKPLNLYKTIENRKLRFLTALFKRNMHRYNDSDSFVTCTEDEMHSLLGTEKNQRTFLADFDNSHLFTSDIEYLLDDIPANYKIRNLLSLAFTVELQEYASSILMKKSRDFVASEHEEYFLTLRRLWFNRIKDEINDFLTFPKKVVTFVVSNDTPEVFRSFLRSTFEQNCQEISFCSLDEIDSHPTTEKFVVFQYRSANNWYKFYPNTFDSLPIAPNQQALVIVNMLTHRCQYHWDNLAYQKALNGLLYSRLRRRHLGWRRKEFAKPENDLREFLDAEHADIKTRSNQRERCTVHYTNNTTKELDVNDRVIYEINGKSYIDELKYVSEYTNFRMELLDNVMDQVKILINENTQKNGDAEKVIRSDPKHGLSFEEIHSSTELWKLLLRKQVDTHGEDDVYEAVFKEIPDNERISKNTFSHWYDPEGKMILPRSRKHRRALLEYLGFTTTSPYYRLIVAKKLTSINDTRSFNSQLENMLKEVFYIKEVALENFEALSEKYADLFMLLDITAPQEVEILRELIDLNYDEVKCIEYGKK